MSRVQLCLNVSDLEESVAFYSRLFGTEPSKIRPGYANFAIAEPALKLVLIADPSGRASGVGGALNHLGIEVASRAEVAIAASRLADEGLDPSTEHEVTCCYALQDKVWVGDPDGAPWEVYTVLEDSPLPGGDLGGSELSAGLLADSGEQQSAVPVCSSGCC